MGSKPKPPPPPPPPVQENGPQKAKDALDAKKKVKDAYNFEDTLLSPKRRQEQFNQQSTRSTQGY